MKQIKCRFCRTPFTKLSLSHKACSPACALELVKQAQEKKARKETAARKVAIRTRSEWVKLAQAAYNRYIRERDRDKPCICCGLPLSSNLTGGEYDCGHYRSVGSAPHLRFDERNAHGQRKQCNRWGSGRAVDYRLGLIKRIGLEQVEALESDQEPRKHTIDEIREIIKVYVAKTKEIRDHNDRG